MEKNAVEALSAAVPPLRAFWGKAGRSASHPAICHMIDAGEVVRAFLTRPTARGLRTVLAQPFGNADVAVRTTAFCGASHDLGKISPGFQQKRPDLAPRLDGCPSRLLIERDHGKVTAWALADYFQTRGVIAPYLAAAIAGHHGVFPDGIQRWRAAGVGPWELARRLHLEALESLFEPDFGPLAGGADPLSAAWYLTLAGVVSVCDWIASAEAHFPYAPDGADDLVGYQRRAAERARTALSAIGMTEWAPDQRSPAFAEMFPARSPNEMQQTLLAMAERADAPGIYVVEAPMGIGKTEGALALAERLVRRLGLAGIYYALPTQATSNQMFDRLRDFVSRRYPGVAVDLHLLHALSDLNPAYQELKLAAVGEGSAETVRASSWFTAAKRGLLAPFGVGTVDQALLAVMQVRHFFVRLLGLAGKVVILDEVHAYDTYVSELLDHLVAWLGALGSPVIVLSATLPAYRRTALVRAYCGKDARVEKHYPAVISATDGVEPVVHAFSTPRRAKLALRPVSAAEDDLAVTASLASSLVQNGGCAAWICNTVDRAQRAYAELRRCAAPDTDVLLLHARFPASWRLERERMVLDAFGKGGSRPPRAILVATQVIEQSLDLDFDTMLSDLAPIDLMLQRAGRLHRHDHARPAGLASPTLHWVSPSLEGGVPTFGVNERVYERYVLLRSWLALQARGGIVLPDDLPELIEHVYGEADPQVDDPRVRQALAAAKERFISEIDEMLQKAERVEIRKPTHGGALQLHQDLVLIEEDDPALHDSLRAMTRLTRPSITIVCATREGGETRLLDGTPIDIESEPTRAFLRSARLSSVAVQRWEWVRHLRNTPAPSSWRHSAVLRECRLAVFENGLLDAGLSTILELSPELGLVLRRRAGGAS